jgi:ATP synthase I chain
MEQPQDQDFNGRDRGLDSERHYGAALSRIRRAMAVLGVAAPLIVWLCLGWRMALGVALGCAIAYVNFHWLARGVRQMAERITGGEDPHSGKGIVSRFLLRYVLMGVAAYGILSVSPTSLYGLLAGLFLPVAAIAWEAVYELYAALTRNI